MGLFINDGQHPDVFKTNGKLVEPNQAEFTSNYLTELIKEQQTSNLSVQRAIHVLKNSQNIASRQQARQWQQVDKRLNELSLLNTQHEQLERQVIDWLEKLDARNSQLQKMVNTEQQDKRLIMNQVKHVKESHGEIINQLKGFGVTNKEIISQLDDFNEVNETVMQQLEEVTTTNKEIIEKIDEQHALQEVVAEQISTIEETQKDLVDRVDKQEGLVDKVLRQIDQVRFILYERTNFLEEKIEKAYEYFNGLSKK